MPTRTLSILVFGWLIFRVAIASADVGPRVVTTIAPLYALIAGVMGDDAQIEVLVAPGASPHTYRLRPSQIGAVHRAGLIVVVGVSELEGFLSPVLADIKDDRRILRLVDVPGMHLLHDRSAGVRVDGKERDHGTVDGHLWLNPYNAGLIVGAIAARLGVLDELHAERYRTNASRLQERIKELDRNILKKMATVRDRPAIVFHDAYQYLEDRYGLNVVATVSVDPEHPPGARRLHDISDLIDAGRAVCLFSEPEYPSRLLASLLRKGIRHASLDPIGSTFALGPELYFSVMNQLADRIVDCLKK